MRDCIPATESDENAAICLNWCAFDAALFDLDGVVTRSAHLHARAWKQVFDVALRQHATETGRSFAPFDLDRDYARYVDGKPRRQGVADFFAARGIDLPTGRESDPAGTLHVEGLARAKNEAFLRLVRDVGVETFADALTLIEQMRARGKRLAVITASRNCSSVLTSAKAVGLFDVQIDGIAAQRLGLAGKPAPDTYLDAARRLDVAPNRAIVFEDSIAGMQAGRAGGFGFVVGVDRTGHPERLRRHGADVVVDDLSLLASVLRPAAHDAGAPPALENLATIGARLVSKRIALFLDYDGTLTPIVARPDLAMLSEGMRESVRRLARRWSVAVISGRGIDDVADRVGLDTVTYGGSHGFEIRGPRGRDIASVVGVVYVPAIRQAAERLRDSTGGSAGVVIEDKTHAVAVHYRGVADRNVEAVEKAVAEVFAGLPQLRKTTGKKIFELRPDLDWDKGRAVLWLLQALKLDGDDVLPIYIGDDVTDQDAFEALRGRGLGLFVGGPQPTCADYRLRDTQEVKAFLDWLGERSEEPDRG